MARESIQLNSEMVKMHIARSGLRNKVLLDGMSDKTIYRIKAGGNTTWATAHKLATRLGTTVEVLQSSPSADDMHGFLPERWLYHETPCSEGPPRQMPFLAGLGGGAGDCLIATPPVEFVTPLEKLLAWHNLRGRKIVLRRDDGAYIFEIHYFDYSPDREQRVKYYNSTACRFYPLARDGDNFVKAPLSAMLDRYVWTRLREEALKQAEIVAIDGHDYPAHPHAYLPLVRFYKGMILNRTALGGRIFEQLHGDFRWSLIDYLRGIEAKRIHARIYRSGICITVDAVRPTPFRLNWQDDMLEFEVELVWRTRDGKLAPAPWRDAHRQEIVDAINTGELNSIFSKGMPLRYFPENGEDDPDPPPFEADPDLSPESTAAINAIAYPSALMAMWEE